MPALSSAAMIETPVATGAPKKSKLQVLVERGLAPGPMPPPLPPPLTDEKRAQMRANQRTATGELKSIVGKRDKSMLRERAAGIAIDMEEHRFIDRRNGKPWAGSYSKSEIAVAMGYSKPNPLGAKGNSTKYPVFLHEPEFSRFVDYERIKRTAKSKMSLEEARPIASIIAGALMLELARRALTEPKNIANRELLMETRKYIGMLAEMEKPEERGGDVQNTINIFLTSVEGLPPLAKKRAMELFDSDIARLTALSGRSKVVDTTAKSA